jgi:triacylglycerol esterase/lipase EstA (alpha/beta hydrolase family)
MNKKLRRWLLVGVWSLSALAHADNSDPIVLVHGFAGWGRDELFGLYPHWGGTTDLQEELKKLGYDTVTAASGPTSSTWDRAGRNLCRHQRRLCGLRQGACREAWP